MTEQRALVLTGGRELSGVVELPGTKHGTVLAFAAAVAAGARLRLLNAPALSDRWVLADIVEQLGGRVTGTGTDIEIDGAIAADNIPRHLAGAIHGSLYLLPAVLVNRGSVTFHAAGGDELGTFEHGLSRPIQHMLDVMTAFGATSCWRDDGALFLDLRAPRPAEIDILHWSTDPAVPQGPYVSGASKTALLMAAAIPGTSTIMHPHSREPQHELISILRALGVRIEQRDSCWLVTGGSFTGAAVHRLMPCPGEFTTWQAIAAVTGSHIEARCADTSLLFAAVLNELAFLEKLHIEPVFTPTSVRLGPARGAFAGRRLVAESTGISTDNAPLLALILNGATTPSVVADRVWTDRFDYAGQLDRLGAAMTVRDHELHVDPRPLGLATDPLTPADTRSAAVCVAAALSVPARTVVYGAEHIERGYGDFGARLRALGADVSLEDRQRAPTRR